MTADDPQARGGRCLQKIGHRHGAAINGCAVQLDDRAAAPTQHIRVLQEKGDSAPSMSETRSKSLHPGSPQDLAQRERRHAYRGIMPPDSAEAGAHRLGRESEDCVAAVAGDRGMNKVDPQ